MLEQITGISRIEGVIRPPGDKSISHRAVILNSIAQGTANVENFSPGADCTSTIECLQSLGVQIQRDATNFGSLMIQGANFDLKEPNTILDAGNSGTTMRLLSGILAGQPFLSILNGDQSLRNRPMGRIVEPLNLMGARIRGRNDDTLAPLVFKGGQLKGIKYTLPVASAQLKSCLLLAGLSATGPTELIEPDQSRDHTERMLASMGASLAINGNVLTLTGGSLNARDVRIPADISSAAFWIVAGVAHPNSRLRIESVGVNPTRTGILETLSMMGGNITLENHRSEGGEQVADILVESSRLHSTTIEGSIIPRLIDEIPVLAVAACFAKGTTIIRDAQELRVKESDRIQSIVDELNRMGGHLEATPDGLIIQGPVSLTGQACHSYGDHRIAMAIAIAGLIAKGETTIDQSECASISYPGFWKELAELDNNGGTTDGT